MLGIVWLSQKRVRIRQYLIASNAFVLLLIAASLIVDSHRNCVEPKFAGFFCTVCKHTLVEDYSNPSVPLYCQDCNGEGDRGYRFDRQARIVEVSKQSSQKQ